LSETDLSSRFVKFDEKLAVNKSCRMLITLSNDVLRQLDTTGTDDHLSDA